MGKKFSKPSEDATIQSRSKREVKDNYRDDIDPKIAVNNSELIMGYIAKLTQVILIKTILMLTVITG